MISPGEPIHIGQPGLLFTTPGGLVSRPWPKTAEEIQWLKDGLDEWVRAAPPTSQDPADHDWNDPEFPALNVVLGSATGKSFAIHHDGCQRQDHVKKPTIWYHGGHRISDWDDLRWDRDRTTSSLNAEGPGMYWTTDPKEALSYGGVLYEGVTKDSFSAMPKRRATLAAMRSLFDLAEPEDQEIFLSNWALEPPVSKADVLRILGKYTHQNTMHDSFTSLYGDLFRYRANAYVEAMRSLGFDGVVVAKGTSGGSAKRKHLILWQPRAMLIQESESPYDD